MQWEYINSKRYGFFLIGLYFPDNCQITLYENGKREFWEEEYKEINEKYRFLGTGSEYPFLI